MSVDPRGRVFVWYRQSDGRRYARDVARALEAAGVPVWRDEDDLPPGDIDDRLRQAVAGSLAGAVLVITPEMAASTVVRHTEVPRLLVSEAEGCAGGRRPLLVYLNLTPVKRPAAYENLLATRRGEFSAALTLTPARPAPWDPAQCGQLVSQVSQAIRALAGEERTSEVHLLPHCPFPVAVHIGRTLNTLRLHVYEWSMDADGERYTPALLVTAGQGQPVERVLMPGT